MHLYISCLSGTLPGIMNAFELMHRWLVIISVNDCFSKSMWSGCVLLCMSHAQWAIRQCKHPVCVSLWLLFGQLEPLKNVYILVKRNNLCWKLWNYLKAILKPLWIAVGIIEMVEIKRIEWLLQCQNMFGFLPWIQALKKT